MKEFALQITVSLAITALSIFAYDRFRIYHIENKSSSEFKMDKSRLDSAVDASLRSMNEISALKSEFELIKEQLKK